MSHQETEWIIDSYELKLMFNILQITFLILLQINGFIFLVIISFVLNMILLIVTYYYKFSDKVLFPIRNLLNPFVWCCRMQRNKILTECPRHDTKPNDAEDRLQDHQEM